MSATNPLLDVNIVSAPLITALVVISAVMLVYLLVRRPTRRWLMIVGGGLLAGGLAGLIAWFFIVQLNNSFGIPIRRIVFVIFGATVVAIVIAVANFWGSRRGRKVIAAGAILVFSVTGTLGINALVGLDRTLGSLFGMANEHPIPLPSTQPAPKHNPLAEPLWKTWKPGPDLPAKGTVGTQVIPNTVSGFSSRPAGIYLPPAALVANPPPLPFVIMMMGQPGAPDPQYIATVLDKLAAQHNGLAPIVIVADQIGDPNQDPLCMDTTQYGNAKTFIVKDVVNWALANLNITHDHKDWTIVGYSNGGGCAISYLAQYPKMWPNVIDISGEEYPGTEQEEMVLADIFGGNQGAYDAIKPENLLAAQKLTDTFGVFTVGSNDENFVPGVKRISAVAAASGMTVVYYESPNGGHVLPALTDGLAAGFDALYPRLGLSQGAP